MSYSEWDSYNLNEVYDISSGLSKSRKEFGFGYSFVTFKDVFYNFFIPEELTELANTSDKERLKCSVERGDVLLTRTSETLNELGQSSVALKTYPNATFNGFTKRLRPNGVANILPEYAGYYFRSPYFRAEVTSMATMTTRASLNNDILSRLKIVVPPLREQKSIAKILFSLDQKIKVNNQINENLQSISQLLFKHWFVDFEFPNEEGNPYSSSGGEMVESQLGMIPKGWEVKAIQDVCNIRRGASPRPIQAFMDETKGGIPWIKIADATSINTPFLLRTKEFIKEKGKTKSVYINEGTLIVSNSATPGIPKFVEFKACVHDGWLILDKYEDNYRSFMYFLILSLRRELINLSNGSVFNNLKTDIVKSYKFVDPSKTILDKFEKIIECLMIKILNNSKENESLTNLRDTLLPKLMSGEIDLSNIEIND